MPVKLRVEEVKDPVARENFQKLENEFGSNPIHKGTWRFVEMTFTDSVANYKFPHGLNFVPKDVIPTSVIGAGDITFHYDDFDRTNIQVTTTGACVVRALVGKIGET